MPVMGISRRELLYNLANDTYCRIGKSKIHGVGVFAIRDIPKGINPFKRLGKEPMPIEISHKEYKSFPSGIQKMIKDYSQKENGWWYIPDVGFNGIDVSFYMNHSNKPNVCLNDSTLNRFVYFTTIKKIKKGEELYIDYRT